MTRSLEVMRSLLALDAGLDASGALLDELNPDLLGRVLAHTPGKNAQVAAASRDMRRNVAAARTPLWFNVNVRQYPGATDIARVREMLTALEAKAWPQRFMLLSIEMPHFKLDVEQVGAVAGVYGSYRLAGVLLQCGAWLQSLDLSHTNIQTWTAINAALPACVALQRVKLTNANVTQTNPFAGLAQCVSLRELVIEESGLSVRCQQLAPVLRACTALTKLNLAENPLYVRNLAVLPHVYSLNYITVALLNHPSLQHLDLCCCLSQNIDCLNLLLGMLPTLARLEYLNLAKNRLDAASITIVGMILQRCPRLGTLDLRQNTTIDAAALHELAISQGMRGLASLNISRCFIECRDATGGNSFLDELPNCARLARLDLSQNDLGDGFMLGLAARLPACRALTRLDLAYTEIGDVGIRALAEVIPRCPGLTRLNLRENPCTPETAKQLKDAWRATHGQQDGLWMD